MIFTILYIIDKMADSSGYKQIKKSSERNGPILAYPFESLISLKIGIRY